jgi:long-chain acyl-CoA synthetase
MQGYYNRPDETAAILRDGWLYTGDLGRLDDEGFLYVTGRKKEIIILPNGKNVNPVELEEKIAESVPGVEEVAVFMQGSTLRAMVRPSEHAFATAPAVELEQRLQRQLDEHYNAQAAPYKRIARIHVIRQELPRTRMGKLRRFQLAELISHNAETSHQAERPEADPDSGTYRKLKSCLSTIVESTIHADDRLEADLGVDSLGRISLQVYIQEAFGIELDEKTFASAPTLRLLTELVDAQKTKDETGEINWQHILHSTTPQALPECGILHTLIVGFAKLLVRCSSIAIAGSASGSSTSATVSPMSTPSSPTTAQISPHPTLTCSSRSSPSNVKSCLTFTGVTFPFCFISTCDMRTSRSPRYTRPIPMRPT